MARWLALLVACFLIGCGSGYELTPEEQAIADTFDLFDEFADAVSKAGSVTVFEGLPHEMLEKDLFDKEKATKPNIEIDGYSFYSSPMNVSDSDLKELKDLVTSSRTFQPYRGGKACGGFHPDYGLAYQVGNGELTVLLCFGCGDMHSRYNDLVIDCEMSDGGKRRLKDVLWKYHVNRPATNVPNYRN